MIRPPELIPYARHHITPEDEAAVLRVLRSKWLTQGPKVEEFEAALCYWSGAKYAVAVHNGTFALFAAYRIASLYGIQRAWIPAITFVATANAATLAGLAVDLCDTDAETGLASWNDRRPQAGTVAVPVTLGGQPVPCPLGPTILDAAHGPIQHGGWMTCLSFHPCKHVACGEGGAILTNDRDVMQLLREQRDHGRQNGRTYHPGLNGRMTELQAALGIIQLSRYAWGVERRKAIAAYYDNMLRPYLPRRESVYHLYQIHVARRDEVRAHLQEAHVGTQVHYRPLWEHEPYKRDGIEFTRFPGAALFAASTLSIPMFPSLTDAEVEYVATTVRRVVEECQ